MNVAPGRAPFGRPAIPIDIAAFSYHWSALKIARLFFFFSDLACESDFLALVDLEVPFFDILSTRFPVPLLHLSRGAVAVTEGQRKKTSSRPHRNRLIFK